MWRQGCLRCDRIPNSLLRTLLLIAFGLANVNNGLTAPQLSPDAASDELHRNINQNLIMSPSAPASASATATVALPPGSATVVGAYPAPSSSITASSSSSSFYRSASGSSITSFDSDSVLTRQQQQQQAQQHQFGGRQSAKDGAQQQQQQQQQQRPHYPPLHKVVGVGVGGREETGGLNENLLLDTNTSAEGELFAAPMYFGTENSTLVTTQIGATAHIPCTIHHIGDGVVSWIRKKDYHLLTVGLTTYSSDERFSATHLKHSEDWTLQIKFVQLRDAGVYECQVSTHPPTSIFLHLNVVEARAEISGPPIRYLTPGSTLRLQCRVVQNTEASEFIFWYHDNRMINYDIDRGINVSTEPDFQSSELTILRTRREHSGNFTCVASNTQPASVLVHIFKGDNPAAMYHGHVGSSTKSYQTHLHSLMVIASTGYRIFCSHIRIRIV